MPVLIQRIAAVGALLLVAPLLAMLAVVIRATSRGPAIHGARRVGPHGDFTVHKLRTMRNESAIEGIGITAAGDQRVTGIGRFLRRTKLDELPQLWDVVRGEMALVGPRPEDPRYVDRTDPLHREVFAALPGITGPASLAYRDEETILAAAALELARAAGRDRASDVDVETAYRATVLPAKLAIDAAYLRTRSTRGDLAILGRTIGQVLGGNTRR